MSRLIDADVIPYLYPVDDDGNDGDGMTLKSTIDEIPTVKAIPLDKLEQIRNNLMNMPFYFGTTFHGKTIKTVDVEKVIEMLDKAIKEQDE